MYALDRSTYGRKIQRPIVTGTELTDEGMILKSVLVGGDEHVTLAGAGTGEILVGFNDNNSINLYSEVVIEDNIVVPSTSPYTVNLKHGNLVAGSVRVYAVAAAANLVIGTDVTVDLTNGVLTFVVAQKGLAMIVTYRRNLTVKESVLKYHQRQSNASNPLTDDMAVILTGDVEIYTDQYDTSVSYDSVTTVYAGAGGLLTSVATGHTALNGRLIHVPTADDPLLGVAVKF